MGMFDTVVFTCPKCNRTVEHQSKAGDCLLRNYGHLNVPLVIAHSIVGETVHCGNCNTSYEIAYAVDTPEDVPMKLITPSTTEEEGS